MENLEEKNSNELKVSDVIKENITSGMKWAKFLNILMCIAVAFMLLAGVMVILVSSITSLGSSSPVMGIAGIFYILFALIYIYPIKLCFSGIRNVKDAFQYDSQEDLEAASDNLRKLLKFMGIVTITMIAIYLIAFFILFIVGVASGFSAYNSYNPQL